MDQSSNMENTCYRLSLRLRLAHFIYFFFYDNDKGTRFLFQQNVSRYAYSLMEYEVYTKVQCKPGLIQDVLCNLNSKTRVKQKFIERGS